jgi:hypothetical protein
VLFTLSTLFPLGLIGCGASDSGLAAVAYTPKPGGAWDVSTPAEQGLDPDLIAQLYLNASQLDNVYSVLVFKNDYLIAEDYFNIGTPEQQLNIHSVTKSITGAAVGLRPP